MVLMGVGEVPGPSVDLILAESQVQCMCGRKFTDGHSLFATHQLIEVKLIRLERDPARCANRGASKDCCLRVTILILAQVHDAKVGNGGYVAIVDCLVRCSVGDE